MSNDRKEFTMPPRLAFGEEEFQAVKELFEFYREKQADFGYQGYFEEKYTQKFLDYLGIEGYADAVCTGTAAIFVAIAALNLKIGSKVLVSCVTDPGTINAIILNQLVPVLVDTAGESFNIGVNQCEEVFEKHKDAKAILVVHAGGIPAPIDKISEFAFKMGLYVIEDCSQAHGAKCFGKKVGTFGTISAFSTMYRKAHSTGGCGGVIFTKNKSIYEMIRSHADRGKAFHVQGFKENNPMMNLFPALNLNIEEISCAIGIASLSKLDDVIQKRLSFLSLLRDRVNKTSSVCHIPDCTSFASPFFQSMEVDESQLVCTKTEFAQHLIEKNVTINPDYRYVASEWPWLQSFLPYKYPCLNAIEYRKKSFNLLFNERFSIEEADYITKAILDVEANEKVRR